MDWATIQKRRPVPLRRSCIALDMALGVGAGSTLFDKSIYRAHGTISGAAWAAGAHGYALEFNSAAKDYVEISADYDHLNFISDDFSIIVRLYVDNYTDYRWIMCRGFYQVDGWDLRLAKTSGKIQFFTSQAGAYQLTSGTVLPAGQWGTIGMSRSGASVRIYKNGIDVVTSAGTHVDPVTSARSTIIGIRDGKVQFPFDGKIEFLRTFKGVALSASEHLAYHNALA